MDSPRRPQEHNTKNALHHPQTPAENQSGIRIRFITAASLFDGHDAAINIMRRILQSLGAEVIHLGHNRSVGEIVRAAIQEDAAAIAISSYQGGHVEFFKYMIDLLKQNHASHIRVFGGGGGTITPSEAKVLEAYGVSKIYSPEDGRKMGLEGMIQHMISLAAHHPLAKLKAQDLQSPFKSDVQLAQALTCIELGESAFHGQYEHLSPAYTKLQSFIQEPLSSSSTVIGMTGTGGAGKSSLTDELVLRFLERFPDDRIAVLAVDPTRRKTGGALLGDRLRMGSLKSPRTYMRSLATREANASLSHAVADSLALLRRSGFRWIFLESGGIGQADTSMVGLADIHVYVMTSEFGAPTQLEKINMLDYADVVAVNKLEKPGALDALTEVRKAFRRNHRDFEKLPAFRYPVIGTMASRFADLGVNTLFEHLVYVSALSNKRASLTQDHTPEQNPTLAIVPRERTNYLSDVSRTVRTYHSRCDKAARLIHEMECLETAASTVSAPARTELTTILAQKTAQLEKDLSETLSAYEAVEEQYSAEALSYQVRDKTFTEPLTTTSLSQLSIRRIALPKYLSRSDRARFCFRENLPGYFPFTGGVFPLKRKEEDPKRMFAGEGTPTRTNRRFHLLCEGEKAKRLSTAFDSVTLYGEDPAPRPDIFGKIGESGVSVCTLDDAKKLYSGFDLCDPNTSVSMTINGPAPMLLAFYFNAAIDQQVDRFVKEHSRSPSPEEYARIQAHTLGQVRGTVQADILKEDQAQNTCIFSTPFALRMMGDMQEYFVKNQIRNYYSVSISGYHIAEAGANPISQLAFTLANGFTFLEYYQARGMQIDDFAPNFSFFFSNGLDPEYTVLGRVARRIWAIALKYQYRASVRSQKLKYHIQTSGRSLHAQEIQFNDIRTTLQALLAYFDQCNSLHTNAYDEAITTPTEESVRRAMAIQLILTKEFGWAKNENPLQGSFFIEELTDLVEEAVLKEFDRISARGGVLGAMETQYQRSKIQEESMHYEHLKHSGELPIVGVNTYLNPNPEAIAAFPENLTRATYEEKQEQIRNVEAFKKTHEKDSVLALKNLKSVVVSNANVFEALMHAARVCSLGQMSQALYEIGGEYRRSL